MSRKYDDVHIREARNGFIVHDVRPEHATTAKPYVFETFDSMVNWLRENYIEGTQPASDA